MINRLNEIASLLDKVSNSPSVVRHIPELMEARGLLQNMIEDANEPENRHVRLVNPVPQRHIGPYGDGVPFGQ